MKKDFTTIEFEGNKREYFGWYIQNKVENFEDEEIIINDQDIELIKDIIKGDLVKFIKTSDSEGNVYQNTLMIVEGEKIQYIINEKRSVKKIDFITRKSTKEEIKKYKRYFKGQKLKEL